VSVLGTNMYLPFHGLQEFVEFPHHAFFRFSPLRYSPELYAWTRRQPRSTYPEASGPFGADTWYRNINLFPFRYTRVTVQLRIDLPSADEHCRGNLAPAADGILTHLCFYYCQNSQFCTVHWTLRPSFYPCRTPLYEITFRCSVVSVVGFSPVHFQRPKP
jgi:hypothetical protein